MRIRGWKKVGRDIWEINVPHKRGWFVEVRRLNTISGSGWTVVYGQSRMNYILYKTKEKARKSAVSFMRRHPRG